jgi:hypothetical protein
VTRADSEERLLTTYPKGTATLHQGFDTPRLDGQRLDACAEALDGIAKRLDSLEGDTGPDNTLTMPGRDSVEARTDPPVSEAQRRLMRAAAAGEVEGVSKSVGEEFSNADPGGKLPEHSRADSGGTDADLRAQHQRVTASIERLESEIASAEAKDRVNGRLSGLRQQADAIQMEIDARAEESEKLAKAETDSRHDAKWNAKVPRGDIHWLVGRMHVSTPDKDVAADIRSRCNAPGYTPEIVNQSIAYALECHHRNQALYHQAR